MNGNEFFVFEPEWCRPFTTGHLHDAQDHARKGEGRIIVERLGDEYIVRPVEEPVERIDDDWED